MTYLRNKEVLRSGNKSYAWIKTNAKKSIVLTCNMSTSGRLNGSPVTPQAWENARNFKLDLLVFTHLCVCTLNLIHRYPSLCCHIPILYVTAETVLFRYLQSCLYLWWKHQGLIEWIVWPIRASSLLYLKVLEPVWHGGTFKAQQNLQLKIYKVYLCNKIF